MSTGYLDANFENWDGGFSIIIITVLSGREKWFDYTDLTCGVAGIP